MNRQANTVVFILFCLAFYLAVIRDVNTGKEIPIYGYEDPTTTTKPDPNVFENRKFNYVINPGHEICRTDDDVTLLAIIAVRSDAFRNRQIHRKTWASRSLFPALRSVFLIGESLNSTVNEMVKEESYIYGDIVQEDYIDSYRNLTLKSVSGIKWASKYCSNAKFVMKIDDDMIVNTGQLLNYLEDLIDTDTVEENTFYCKPLYNNKVIRQSNGPWGHLYMSKADYPYDKYHTYCQGMAYVFTSRMARLMYNESKRTRLLPMEDVYIGLLGQKINAHFKDIWEHFLYDWYTLDDRANRFANFSGASFDKRFLIFIRDFDKDYLDIVSIWKMLLERHYEIEFGL